MIHTHINKKKLVNFKMIVSDNFLFFLHFAKFGILKVFGGNFEILVFWTLGTKKL